MKQICLCLILLILTGCATAAQRQAETIKSVAHQTVTELKTCLTDVYAKPEYDDVVVYMPSPENNGKPTMAQLANDSFPTKKESDLLISLHDESIPCKQTALTKLESIVPGFANVFADEMVDGDKLTLQLVKRKITWGTYNKKHQELVSKYRDKAKPVAQQIVTNLNNQNQAELAQRQALAQAIGNALQQWGQAAQRNQPVYTNTNCMKTGSSISCNSYSQ